MTAVDGRLAASQCWSGGRCRQEKTNILILRPPDPCLTFGVVLQLYTVVTLLSELSSGVLTGHPNARVGLRSLSATKTAHTHINITLHISHKIHENPQSNTAWEQKIGVVQKFTGIQNLWTELMVTQWNSSEISSQDSPHCSSVKKFKSYC